MFFRSALLWSDRMLLLQSMDSSSFTHFVPYSSFEFPSVQFDLSPLLLTPSLPSSFWFVFVRHTNKHFTLLDFSKNSLERWKTTTLLREEKRTNYYCPRAGGRTTARGRRWPPPAELLVSRPANVVITFCASAILLHFYLPLEFFPWV